MSIITESNIDNYKVVNGDGVDASIINDTVETAVNAYSNSQKAITTSNEAVNTATLADKKIEEFIKTEGNSVVTLNGVPQVTWSADFAESERQKSKNLFNVTKAEPRGYSWQGVPSAFPNASYISCGFIKIKPNTNYIFSYADKTIPIRYTGALFYTADKTYIGYDECNQYTFKTPSNAEYMLCQFWFESNPMNYKDIIQIEENIVATEFQPYSGQITHNGDAPVVFAESERQKSKNLFNINVTFDKNRHTTVNGDTIVVEGNGDTSLSAVFDLIPVKENTTYYIGANANNKRLIFRIYDENKNIIQSAIPNWIYNQYWKGSYSDFSNTEIRTQLTIPVGAKYLAFCTAWMGDESIISNIIISEYSDVEDYQPYHGPTTHNNDAPVMFAEAERQKSKNLWDNKKILTDYLADRCVPSATGLKLTTQYETGSTYASNYEWPMNLKAGVTYTLSCKHINYTTPSGTIFCRWVTASGKTLWVPNFNTAPTQFTPSEDIVGVQFYLQSGTIGTSVEVEDIQIEEGNVATEYQPYNGAIVHEKKLLDSTMCLIDEIYIPNESFTSISFENIGCKDGEVFKLIISGSTNVAADGHILFNNIDSGMQSLVVATYAEEGTTGNAVVSNTDNGCPFRVDTGYFYGELTVGCNHLYNGSSLWYDLITHQEHRSSGANYFRHVTGSLLDTADLNRITVYFGAYAYRGTRLKLYKLGGKLTG